MEELAELRHLKRIFLGIPFEIISQMTHGINSTREQFVMGLVMKNAPFKTPFPM